MIDKALATTHIARENLVLREVLKSEMGKTVIIGSSREILHEAEKVQAGGPDPAPRCCCAAKAAPARSCSPAPSTP